MGGLSRRLDDARERIEEEVLHDAAQDEREEKAEAVLREVRETPEGRGAEEDLAHRLREHSQGVLGVLRSEGGREAVSSFRDAFFEAQDRIRKDEQGDNE